MSGQEVLELLRNLSEHWDEIGGRSAEKLEENYPDVSVDTVKCTNKEIWIANVPLSRIRAWVNRVRESLIAALESVGVDVPDDMGSMIGGDDALSWPADRHRYRLWMIPLVEMRDWPTDEIPTEVGALISERFARLRARDVTD
ncbi:hypothetical protein [Actinocatenispora comari]|nr:hypothetical protein [Actinocatenispora comari]